MTPTAPRFQATTRVDWMKSLSDSLQISEISIPGSHNTCTYTVDAESVRCQDVPLEDQLNSGIRFLDLKCRQFYDKMHLHNGSAFLGLLLNNVIDDCRYFLQKNPSEVLFMLVKPEYNHEENKESFERILKDYLDFDKPTGRNYQLFYTGRTFPKLSEVRGKIVLLNRSANNSIGIDVSGWQDNLMQNAIMDLMKESIADPLNQFFINCTSDRALPMSPKRSAEKVNPILTDHLKKNQTQSKLGAMVMDFPTQELIDLIIQHN